MTVGELKNFFGNIEQATIVPIENIELEVRFITDSHGDRVSDDPTVEQAEFVRDSAGHNRVVLVIR